MRLDYGLACVALCATTVSAVRTGSTVCNNVLCVTGIHDSQTKMDTCASDIVRSMRADARYDDGAAGEGHTRRRVRVDGNVSTRLRIRATLTMSGFGQTMCEL
jgi:hypothetical protein